MDLINKFNYLMKTFNHSFDISANIIEENGNQIANGLKIDNIKDNGTEFMNEFFTMINQIIQSTSDEYELVYDEKHGLAIAKKVIKVEYIIEE